MAEHITITAIAEPVTVSVGGVTLGESHKALELKEGSYPPVTYVPREDIDMSLLKRTEKSTTCPWKGRANYYSVRGEDAVLENAVWTYEEPLADVAPIAGHLAFYTDRVTVRRG
ncbi:DUF427 domain-containing protein [Tabrizicola sp.]|uniref:DUF427 domain-containing protein n=1 Tax=Tabrizicola sp. TaxID=2005166 RepID=UPI0027349765|nr:DUF427 domain-containing protein [Tabrizicola sp.]MDP3197117.1 DUF427 domain-containing protein [Tabrizicola sp.]